MIGSSLGHYRILRKLGSGGMAEVYAAEDTKLKRVVALKILPPEMAADAERRGRFEREAKAIAALDHPNIVTVFSVEEIDGVHFITMQLVEGKTLAELIPKHGIPQKRFFELAIPIAEAVSAAHQRGVTHRDLKPRNIMVSSDGRVRILDFGLAKLIEETPSEDTDELPTDELSGVGKIMGTVAYMSPEQVQGKPIDHRTDIFSLGVILYEMVTGHRPFKGDSSAALITSILRDTPHSVSDLKAGVPRQLGRIIRHCLEDDPQRRFQTAADVRNELAELQKEIESGELLASDVSMPAQRAPRRPARTIALVGAGVLAVAVAVVGLADRFWPGRTGLGTEAERKRIVVLPLENLGPGEQEYFADGITDEITSRLASVAGLGVISRTSAMQYKENRPSIKQIGRELSVDYALEGSVRWASGRETPRVTITPRLVRVSDDTQMWSQVYQRPLDDIFEIQSEIAKNVVAQLGATLLEPERVGVEAKPTENLAAYQAYLRGLYFRQRPEYTLEHWQEAVDSFQRAVELDPHFVAAWAELAYSHALIYFLQMDTSDERKAHAKAAAERAVELAPEDPAARVALGNYYYNVEGDYERALENFAIAEKALPGDPRVLEAIGYVERRQGQWTSALSHLEAALDRNPRDGTLVAELGETYACMRRYPEAVRTYDRAIALAPDVAWPYVAKAWSYWLWKGKEGLAEAREVIAGIPEPSEPMAVWARFWQEIYEGRHERALEVLDSVPREVLESWHSIRPKALLAARTYSLMGQPEPARESYARAAAILEREIAGRGPDPRLHGALGVAYAGLGRKEEAVREGRRAIALLPLSKDAFNGGSYEYELAIIYAMSGEARKAIEHLDRLLSVPWTVSAKYLELDPLWEDVRRHPDFRKLAEK